MRTLDLHRLVGTALKKKITITKRTKQCMANTAILMEIFSTRNCRFEVFLQWKYACAFVPKTLFLAKMTSSKYFRQIVRCPGGVGIPPPFISGRIPWQVFWILPWVRWHQRQHLWVRATKCNGRAKQPWYLLDFRTLLTVKKWQFAMQGGGAVQIDFDTFLKMKKVAQITWSNQRIAVSD